MRRGRRWLTVCACAGLVFAAPPTDAAGIPTQCVYVANFSSNNVSAIQVKVKGNNKKVRKLTPKVIATVPVGRGPWGIVADPVDSAFVLVTNSKDGTVSRIDTATNTVTATIRVGKQPRAVTVNHDGTRAYVGNYKSNSISVIDTDQNTVIDTVKLAVKRPVDLEVDPSGTRLLALSTKLKAFEVLDIANSRLGADRSASVESRGDIVPFGACTDLIAQAVPGFEDFYTVAGACGAQLCRWAAPDGTTVCFDSPLGEADVIAGRPDCPAGCETMVARSDTGTVVFESPAGATADSPFEFFVPTDLSLTTTTSSIAPGSNWTMGSVVGFDGSGDRGSGGNGEPADYPGLLRIFAIDTRAANNPKIVIHETVELPDARGSMAVTNFPV